MARVRRKARSRGARSARDGARRELAEGARRSATRYAGAGGDAERHLCFSFVGRRAAPGESRATRREKRPSRRAKRRPTRRVRAEVRCGQRAVAVWNARSVCALFYPRALYEKYLDDGRSLRVYSMDPERPNRLPTGSGSQRHRRSLRTARGHPDSPREDGGHPLQGQVRRAPVPVRDHGGHPVSQLVKELVDITMSFGSSD